MTFDPSLQTTDQWLAANNGGVAPAVSDELKEREAKRERRIGRMYDAVSDVRTFVYDSHRTTKKHEHRATNCLVLEFIDTETGEPAVAFFNVESQGHKKIYRTGQNQPFIPPERGKFRRWWMSIVGRAPRRWSRVHKELKPRLSGLVFTGEVEHLLASNNEPYIRLSNVRLAPEQPSTVRLRSEHRKGTERAQASHKVDTEPGHSETEQNGAINESQPDETTWQEHHTDTQQHRHAGAQEHSHTGRLSIPDDMVILNQMEAFRERAAIQEHDGGLSRHEAELLAAEQNFRLKNEHH